MTNPLKNRQSAPVAPLVERTQRGWKPDMVDAMNRTMNAEARDRGLQWMIAGNGDVYLDFTFAATRQNLREDIARQEAERRDWKRKRREVEME